MASASLAFKTLFLFSLLSLFLTTNHAKFTTADFISQAVDGHNTVRQAVGVPPLVYEPLLARVARIYANERRHDCNATYSPGTKYGENIYVGNGNRVTVKDAVATWAAEKQWYNYMNNTCAQGETCSDYTQVVWSTTKRVGCSQVICDNGNTFVVCEYYPPGNYIGARPY